MKFGPVPLSEATGAILAHAEEALAAKGDSKTYLIRKGTVLEAPHVAALMRTGLDSVVAARLEPGDVHEDAAATALADAIMGQESGLLAGGGSTGRVNLRASSAGIVEMDVDAIHAVNRVDPGITVATVPNLHRLDKRGLAATIKIIPYAVSGAALKVACDLGAASMRLRQPKIATATLIETRVGQQKLSLKGRQAIKSRMSQLNVQVSDRVVVPHTASDVAEALRAVPGELLMILTGSATSDLRDTAPASVELAGGQVHHYGMPVDPGNLLFLGQLDNRWVVGLPGCARSPALNGADWVLERVICGLDVTPSDIAAMGVGGLLKEIPSRPVRRRDVEHTT